MILLAELIWPNAEIATVVVKPDTFNNPVIFVLPVLECVDDVNRPDTVVFDKLVLPVKLA